jgi:hypothetical protein
MDTNLPAAASGRVLIIGAGITGIRAALNLAGNGIEFAGIPGRDAPVKACCWGLPPIPTNQFGSLAACCPTSGGPGRSWCLRRG